ncbi:hypothetical protein [Streptomyces asiaticus]|uniref:hypothetical protein n=1 Tax=Streptomyces asiaticus TaxID=114695 RepID=UPI00381FDEC0
MSNQPHQPHQPHQPNEPHQPHEPHQQQGQQPQGQHPQQPYPPYGSYEAPYGGYDQSAHPYGGHGHGQGGQQQADWQGYAGYPQQQGYAQAQPPQYQHPQQQYQQQPYADPYAAAQQGHQGQQGQQPHQGQQGQYAQGWAQQQHPYHQPAAPSQTPAQTPAQAQAPAQAATATAEPPAPQPDRPLTAAEKAKAEGRPQILHPGFVPAALTSVLAALLAATAPLGRPAVAVAVAALQAVTAAGWFRLNGMWPARQGIALAFAGGLAADIGLLATEPSHAPTVVIGTIGVWLLLVLILQLRSHASPDERLYGLTAAVAATALAVLAAGHLAAVAESSDAVVVGAAAVAVAVLVRALPLPTAAAVVVALAAATGAGVGAGQLTGTGTSTAALLGFAAGACALIGHRVASYDYPSRFVHLTAGVALPLAAAAPVVYVIGRALG